MLNYSREKNEGAYRSRDGGEGPLCEEGPLRDPGSEILLGGTATVVQGKKIG